MLTPERCREIEQFTKDTAKRFGLCAFDMDIRKHMTEAEHQEVLERWRSMPGWTCYMDAFNRIKEGR